MAGAGGGARSGVGGLSSGQGSLMEAGGQDEAIDLADGDNDQHPGGRWKIVPGSPGGRPWIPLV